MAAEAAAEARGKTLEEAVNHWALLFYAHQAMQAFRAGRSRDFRQLRDVIYALLARPLAQEQHILLQLRIIQLLSRIEEDWTIDTETEQTPLECALVLLEKMKNEVDIEANVIEEIRTKIKEAAVIACVKNKEFEQANKILKKYPSKDPSTQKMRTLLHSIIREKNSSHPTIWNFSYKAFQQGILLVFEGYLDDSEPFLLAMAKKNSADSMETQLSSVGTATEEMVVSEPVGETLEMAAAADPASTESVNEALMEPGPEEGRADELREDGPPPLEGDSETTAGPLPVAVASQEEAASEHAEMAGESVTTSEPSGEAKRGAEPAVVAVAMVSVASDSACGTMARPLFCRCPPKRPAFHGLSALREAFKALSDCQAPDDEFSKLDETDWTCPKPSSAAHRAKRPREEEEEEEEEDDKRDTEEKEKEENADKAASDSQLLLWEIKGAATISSMVMGPQKERCTGPNLRTLFTKKPVMTLAVEPAEPQSLAQPLAPPFVRLSRVKVNPPTLQEEKEVWSDEDELFLDQGSKGRNSADTSISSAKRKKWTKEESAWIKAGVRKFGEGNWRAIFQAYPFKERTPVMIKDRWRTMKRMGLA
ncbi:telomeric repeat-binding factor 2 [Elgaria multicarinata webbii]|uniref:telomeric repeat-binding factor 2 n=1 Tax=Elgaria multicarinata webbii TaxID=159646 RepID=UPI002FCCC54E